MDYIRFHCPACNHLLVVPPEAAGMSGPCPNCHTTIQGPNHYTPPQPQPLNPPTPETPVHFPPPTPEPAEPHQPPFPSENSVPDLLVVSELPEEPTEPAISEPVLETESEAKPEQPAPKHRHEKGRQGGLSLFQALLLSFIFSIIFFGLGLYLGKTGAVSWDDLLRNAQQQQELEPQETETETKEDTVSITPLANDEPEVQMDSSGAHATLEAFLAAGTWSIRNAYVLYPNLIIEEMEASAKFHGDGPIPTKSITLKQDQPNQKVFWVTTEKNSRPFSVVLIKDRGNWLVDWAGFSDFYYNRLQAFADGREGPMQGVFRVFLKAAPGETAPLSPARCLVMAPQNEGAYQVNSPAESPARKKLAEIFQAYLQADPESFKDAMKGPGIPLIVKLSRNGAVNPTLNLQEIITTGWAPLPPEDSKKGNLSSFY